MLLFSNKNCFLFSENRYCLSNREDHQDDDMSHNVAFHLGQLFTKVRIL